MRGIDRDTGQPISGPAYLRQRIANVLTTAIGSSVMRRDYGSEIPAMIDMVVNPANVLLLYGAIAGALQRWVGDFKLTRVELLRGQQPGQFVLALEGQETGQSATPEPTQISVPLRITATGLTTA
ncbi:GPW/gp25 family protein [Caulobacter segnis]|uniref:IraD/Gp25-like domain-containing protein n=1 Tax=Caulobacter segnis TaxID=88688 RepID=A0A2W5X821_9CAUL|nr:GPW/gp25 family protein [Caulobacter segnis]PZR37184.1 MAG: hypothetical protein DI526_01320 [Caulobacter segnis]